MSSETDWYVTAAGDGSGFPYPAALQELLLEQSHDLITVVDAVAGTIVYVSPSWRELGWQPEQLVGRPALELVHPDDRAAAAAALADAVAGSALHGVAVRVPTTDGRWLPAETNAGPVAGADGGVAYVLAAARDVGEREELRTRATELSALSGISDAIARGGRLDDLLEEAVGILIEATGAGRASVLLLDDEGVMRFRAWRDLSDEYRDATDGHSPWTPDTADPEPVLVADVAVAGFEEPLARAVRAEGIGALAFVPLVHAGRLVGKFMLYHDAPHVWREREIRLAQTIAAHLASATVRSRAQEALRASSDQLSTILRTVAEGILVQSRSGEVVYANDAAAELIGYESAERLLGLARDEMLRPFELYDEDGAPLDPSELPARRALRGEAAERVIGWRSPRTGERHWSVSRASPILASGGEVELVVSVFYDITELRTAERRLRESLALVDSLFQATPVGLAFWDTELRYARLNEAIAAMVGRSPEELLGARLTPAWDARVGALLRRVLETGEPANGVEVRDEQRVWRASYYPVRDGSGEIVGIGGALDDVTGERRAGERSRFLARASELLNETLDIERALGALADLAVPAFAGHVTVDLYRDGDLRCVGARHVDPEKTELMLRLRERYPPTVPEHPVQRALASGEPQRVPDVQAEADRMAHDAAHAAAIRELANTSGVVVPLTVRGRTFGAITFGTVPPQPRFDDADLELAVDLARRASAALDNALLYDEAQARAHASEALEFVDDGVVLVDRDGVVRLCNPAAARTFRLDAQAAIGRHLRDLVADWDALADRIRVVHEPSAGKQRATTLPVDVAGEERWLAVSAVRFPGGTVYAFRDLTEERAVEQLKSDFVSTVSHELRTPLAAIYGAALTLRRDDIRLAESQREGLLDVVAGEADRLARIVNDILWASRLDSGQMRVSIERCDGAALAAQVVEALRSHAPAEIRIELDAHPGLPRVAADPDKLRQVLTNLVDNAVKYSPDGGVVRMAAAPFGGRVRFTVADEGLGIPASERERIFEKFFRLDPDLNRGVGGTGLGLYICRELAQRMNGRIWVVSDGRNGSTFTVELPAA